MKKLFAIILVLALTLGVCGCTPSSKPEDTTGTEEPETTSGEVEAGGFRVGYARVNIMPEEPVPLAGYGNTDRRISTGALDYIQATCIAITDAEDNTVLLITQDIVQPCKAVIETVRDSINETTGVPQEHIMLAATHTHSGPDVNGSAAAILAYQALLANRLVEVAKQAMEDRMPAEMYIGSAETENLSYVRHYEMEDGSYAGDNFGDWSLSPVKHATEVDPTIHLLKFAREDGPDVILANWRAHAIKTGGAAKYNISADFIAPFRDTIEQKLDCKFAYFQGAAGNVNSSSRIGAENTDPDYRKYGAQLAACAMEGLENMTKIEPGLLQTKQIRYEATVNHETDAMIAQAREVAEVWTRTNNHDEVRAAGKPYGIRSPYHANAIINRAKMSATDTLELNVIAIGDIAFVTVPDEFFDTNSVYLEEHSPYAKTFFLGYANGVNGYIPSELGFTYTCYESDTCKYIKGTAEAVIDTFLEVLNEFHSA